MVSVRNSERNPISPRVGTSNSMRTRFRPPPLPWFTIFVICPRLRPSASVMMPMKVSGASITTSSIGSRRFPSTSRVITSGLDTWSSNPSRRIISIRIASWSSPRPETLEPSAVSVSSTRIETLPRVSLSRRSRTWRDVT